MLTSRQKSLLRSAARTAGRDAIVGKGGVNPGQLVHIRGLLDRKELIKVRLLESATEDRFATAEALAAGLQAQIVDVVGRMVVLYRPNPQLPPDRRIVLPEA